MILETPAISWDIFNHLPFRFATIFSLQNFELFFEAIQNSTIYGKPHVYIGSTPAYTWRTCSTRTSQDSLQLSRLFPLELATDYQRTTSMNNIDLVENIRVVYGLTMAISGLRSVGLLDASRQTTQNNKNLLPHFFGECRQMILNWNIWKSFSVFYSKQVVFVIKLWVTWSVSTVQRLHMFYQRTLHSFQQKSILASPRVLVLSTGSSCVSYAYNLWSWEANLWTVPTVASIIIITMQFSY